MAMDGRSPLITVVCPAYNEEESLPEFYGRITKAFASTNGALDYHLVFTNNASTDRTGEILKKFADSDPRVSVIELSRNFGHQMSITAGIDHADGDAVVVIDTDLQDPPEVILAMVEKWREGFDVVYAQRVERPGESVFKRGTARMFYRVINWMSDVELPLDVGEFRLMDKRVVDALRGLREENRYLRGLVSWVGFKQAALPYKRDARFAGETKYPFRSLVHFAFDGITSFTEKPLRMAAVLGMLTTLGALVGVIWTVVGQILNPASSAGYASLMTTVLFLGGVQLMTIGILGQYLGRTYREAKDRPLYVVANRQNIGDPIQSRPV